MNEPSTELDRLAHAVIGAAIEVHRHLGPGYLESVYEDAMSHELSLRRLAARRQVTIPIHYKDHVIGESRIDLLDEEALIVELKAVESLQRVHLAQVMSYLKAGSLHLGLLINFNVVTLKEGVRRVVREEN